MKEIEIIKPVYTPDEICVCGAAIGDRHTLSCAMANLIG
jgi:hypothetical protein